MFYNGIISSQEVFQIDLVRNCFPFSSVGMWGESSLWCEPRRALEATDLASSWHAGKTCWAPGGPMHPTHAFCSISGVTPECAASRQAGLQSQGSRGSTGEASACLKGEKNPSSNPPPRTPPPGNLCFSGGSSLSQLSFPACPAGILCLAPGGPFTLPVRRAQPSSKALGRIWWEGEKGFYKLPFRNGHFEVI